MKFRTGDDYSSRKTQTLCFSDFIPEIIKDLNIDDDFTVSALKDSWKNITGAILSVHTKPDRIFKKILFIASDHSMFSNEVMLMKNHIMKGIENTVGAGIITGIKVEIKKK